MGANLQMKNRYLVVHDYGMGGVWAVIRAQSDGEILSRFPTLKIASDRPAWMDDAEYAKIVAESDFDIDAIPPEHWLAKLNAP